MGVIIFTANPLTPPKKLKPEINVLIFGQILNILTLIWATRVAAGPTIKALATQRPDRQWDACVAKLRNKGTHVELTSLHTPKNTHA